MGTLTINSNVASLNAQRRLAQSSASLSDTFTRLSSGLRINKASDDAAGLAIASSLEVDRRVLSQGVRNLSDGISLLSIADGALQELSNITIRLTELAEQAANGALSNSQRGALDEEAQSLRAEFSRITHSTEFNDQKILNGTFGSVRLQSGSGVNGGIVSDLGGAVGDGTFQAPASFATELRETEAVALGDLNNDGNLDMVTAGRNWNGAGDGLATIFLGAGDGTFSTDVSYATESMRSLDIKLGDVNNDGILDIVTSGESDAADGYATVRLGIGDGTFGSATSYATEGNRSYALSIGDVNNDGYEDIVTAGTTGSNQGAVSVLLNQGDGTFASAVSYAAEGNQSHAVELADINEDGVLDLISAGWIGAGNGFATIRLGLGDGSFGAATSYAMDSLGSDDVQIADVNNDGHVDLLTSGFGAGGGSLSVRLGDGSGGFGGVSSFQGETTGTYKLRVNDIDGDGNQDIITAGQTATTGQVSVFLGCGDGTFGAQRSFDTESKTSKALAIGDVDNDGVIDVVSAGQTDGNTGAGSVLISNTTTGVSPLLPFSLKSRAGALEALPIFQRKLDQIASQRGDIGAFEARLTTALATTSVARENYAAAASQITDVDVAEASAQLVRNQIIQQAGVAILGQANQLPELALLLLRQ